MCEVYSGPVAPVEKVTACKDAWVTACTGNRDSLQAVSIEKSSLFVKGEQTVILVSHFNFRMIDAIARVGLSGVAVGGAVGTAGEAAGVTATAAATCASCT